MASCCSITYQWKWQSIQMHYHVYNQSTFYSISSSFIIDYHALSHEGNPHFLIVSQSVILGKVYSAALVFSTSIVPSHYAYLCKGQSCFYLPQWQIDRARFVMKQHEFFSLVCKVVLNSYLKKMTTVRFSGILRDYRQSIDWHCHYFHPCLMT